MDFRLLERVVQWILQFVHEPAYNFVLCLKMLPQNDATPSVCM